MARGFDDAWRGIDPSKLGANRNTTPPARGNKYGAKKALVDGVLFDSRHEADVYLELKMELHAGVITDLQLQREFTLIVTDVRDGQPRAICKFTPDFYYLRDGKPEVKEAKGVRTKDYVIRRNLFEALLGIPVIEA